MTHSPAHVAHAPYMPFTPRVPLLPSALRGALLGSLALLAGPALAQTQAYPAKPIQLIAQQPPGSGSDAMTRIWADCAARELGQPVVVQNKPGANGVLAVNYLKAQPADGYNLQIGRASWWERV